jgi:hypothetical protein
MNVSVPADFVLFSKIKFGAEKENKDWREK